MNNTDEKNNIAKMNKVCVAGASGFVGFNIVREFMAAGYTVHATIRDVKNQIKHAHLLELQKKYPDGKLVFFEADMLVDDSFLLALKGCSAAVHAAAVSRWHVPNPQKNLIDVNLRGVENMLNCIKKTKTIEKLSYTSAVNSNWSYLKDNSYIFTDEDWNNDPNLQEEDPYSYSKLTEERRVWEMSAEISRERSFRCVCINPGFVLGPAQHKGQLNSSLQIVHDIFYGKYPLVPRIYLPFVDVRDVAHAHLAAVENSEVEGRFIVNNDGAWLNEVGLIIKKSYPKRFVPTKLLPDWAACLASVLDRRTTLRLMKHRLGRRLACDGSRAKKVLGLNYVQLDKSLIDTCESMRNLFGK